MKTPFYIDALWKSMSDVSWLRDQRKNFSSASTYFLGIILVVSLASAMYFSHSVLSDIAEVAQKTIVAAPDLSFERKEGKIQASGVEQPFMFESSVEGQSFFVYIDTNTTSEAVPADFFLQAKEKETFFVAVTSDAIRFIEGSTEGIAKSEQKILAEELPEGGISTYGKSAKTIRNFSESNRAFLMVTTVATLVLFVFYTLAQTAFVAFVAFLVWGSAKRKKTPWSFGELFTVGLFAITLPMLLGDVLPLFGLYIPFLGSVVMFAILFAVVFYKGKKIEKNGEEEKQEQEEV